MIQILSDLHIEFSYQIPFVDSKAKILIIAGDLCPTFRKASDNEFMFDKFLREIFSENSNLPIVFVAGNHEYYGTSISKGNDFLKKMNEKYFNFHFLQNEAIQIEGINFIGSTLWTNFKAFNPTPKTIEGIQEFVSDFRVIEGKKGRIRPKEMKDMFQLAWKSISSLKSDKIPNVVITHFGPSERSCHPKFFLSPHSAYFMSNCENLMENVSLWIHGHTHESLFYEIGDTTVVCNPKGYYDENISYKKDLLLSV